jgi:hypothetical protein
MLRFDTFANSKFHGLGTIFLNYLLKCAITSAICREITEYFIAGYKSLLATLSPNLAGMKTHLAELNSSMAATAAHLAGLNSSIATSATHLAGKTPAEYSGK